MNFTPEDFLTALDRFEMEAGTAPKYMHCSRYAFNWLARTFASGFETSYDYAQFIGMNSRYRLFGIEVICDENLRDDAIVFTAEKPVRVHFENRFGGMDAYYRGVKEEIKREFDLGELNLDNMKPLPMDKLDDLLFGA